jgi:hypothetical protein
VHVGLEQHANEFLAIVVQVQVLEDQAAKIPALEATAKTVADTDLGVLTVENRDSK